MQHVHLAQLYARMGYAEAALAQAHTVRIASARMLCQIYCRLTAGHQAIDADQLEPVARYLPEIEDLLHRGIECGALVDPWNILGFGGNFSLFPAVENSVHDFRVDDLIELVEQILDLCARAWTGAAAVDDAKHEQIFSAALERIARWWDRYATASVSGVKRLVAKEIEVSSNLVAGALSAWHKAGAAAGDVKFWRMFVDQFDSPKAFQLVVEALLDRGDQVASMALMMQWLSQVERTPLEDGDASFHPLALRWLRAVETGRSSRPASTSGRWWPSCSRSSKRMRSRIGTCPSSSSRAISRRPEEASKAADDATIGPDDEEDGDELFSAAYEDMIYRDSTDDGVDASLFEDRSERRHRFRAGRRGPAARPAVGVPDHGRQALERSGDRLGRDPRRARAARAVRRLATAGDRRLRVAARLDRSGPRLCDPPADAARMNRTSNTIAGGW